MLTKQLREMERQSEVVNVKDYYKTIITLAQWKRYKTEYRFHCANVIIVL